MCRDKYDQPASSKEIIYLAYTFRIIENKNMFERLLYNSLVFSN